MNMTIPLAARFVYSDDNGRLTMYCGAFSTWHDATNGLSTHSYIGFVLADDANSSCHA